MGIVAGLIQGWKERQTKAKKQRRATMAERFISRGFVGKRRASAEVANRVPPGQYVTTDFPVLSAGPTPRTPLDQWTFTIDGLVVEPARWTWEEFMHLPRQPFVVDIHCVTKWTKLDTRWEGVSLDTLFEHVELDQKAMYLTAYSDGGYTTNLPLADVLNGQAFVAYGYDGRPLPPEHGGPARLVVPHLYFWKSAKWVRGLRLMEQDRRGFWESFGYHNHGDPWKEERYSGD
jgi:DMSO/TMAO reductase YedYZ molybdopterin-dependent catalytic subunit